VGDIIFMHEYQPVCLGNNIEKHASAPLYPENYCHPHPKYEYLYGKKAKMLEIYYESKEFQKLKQQTISKYSAEIAQTGKHWLDFVKVSDIKCECPNKVGYNKILGTQVPEESNVMMYNVCKHTIFAAAKRQMKIAPKPDNKIADDFIKYSKDIIEKEVGEELNQFGYDYNQWYAHNNATKQKDIDRYFDAQINPQNYTKKQLQEMDTLEYTGICKIELQPKDGKPRMVCSIPIKTKVTMGPITWQLEEIMQQKFHGYCGGLNNKQMAQKLNDYIERGFTKIVEGDGSAFDNTQDVTLKAIDRYLYKRVEDKVYHVPKEQFRYVSQQYYKSMSVNYMKGRKKKCFFKYKILGSVFSGDCDTTLCNTLRMALYNRYVNEREGLVYDRDFVLISKGDDFTVLYKPYVTDEFIQQTYYKYFLREAPLTTKQYGLGQVLKMLNIGGTNTISFCSLMAWYLQPHSDKIVLTRDIKKFDNLAMYSRKIKTLRGKQRFDYLIQQAIAITTTYKGIAIFDELANAYIHAALRVHKGSMTEAKKIVAQQYDLVRKAKMLITNLMNINPDTPENQIIYNIKKRDHAYKIQGTYWDTMKALQEDYTRNLTPEQLKYINEQTEAVMELEYFKSRMGLNNLTCQEKLKIKQLNNLITSKIKQNSYNKKLIN
jgi:hypothetical protein